MMIVVWPSGNPNKLGSIHLYLEEAMVLLHGNEFRSQLEGARRDELVQTWVVR